MNCEFCNTINDFKGKQFDKVKNIDGGNQHFEICIFDSPEDEIHVLEINGTYTDIRIEINYCPICGRKI